MSQPLRLTDLAHFIVSLEDATERRTFMDAQMRDWDLEYEFVRAVRHEDPSIGGAFSHLGAIARGIGRAPFVVLEDDCRLYPIWGRPFDLPDDARLFYPGISLFGIASPGEPSWGEWQRLEVSHYDHELLQVRNMLGAHAVVYLDDDIALAAIRMILRMQFDEDYPYPVDVALALLQFEHLALSYRHPLCEQHGSVGGQSSATAATLLPFAAGETP